MSVVCCPARSGTTCSPRTLVRRDLNQAVFKRSYVSDDEVVGADLAPPLLPAAVGVNGRRSGRRTEATPLALVVCGGSAPG